MIVAKADRERATRVHNRLDPGADQVIANGHVRHDSNTVSAAASGAAVGAVAGFAVLPVLGGVIGSVAGGLAGLLLGLATDAVHGDDEDQDPPSIKSKASN